MNWEVGLFGKKLASVARMNELDGVGKDRWPVEALSKGVANECRSLRSFRPSTVMQRCKIPVRLRWYSSLHLGDTTGLGPIFW